MARTVTESKVVYAPIASKDGETSFLRIGVKVVLSDGNWWFYHFKYQSFSKHEPGRPLTTRSGSPVWEVGGTKQAMAPEKITRYGNRESLLKRLPNATGELLPLIDKGIKLALEAEQEKRLARA